MKRLPTRGEKVCAFIEKYCKAPEGDFIGEPIKLERFQRRFILEVYDNPALTHSAYLSIARKNGKGLALDTPIPTPRGWVAMSDLHTGDEVFDENGAPCMVELVSPIHIGLKCWRLTFSDGSEIIADEQHRWLTKHKYRPWANGRHREYGSGKHKPHVVTTPQIAESVRRPRTDGKIEFNHSISVAKALKTTPSVDLPLDPYLLGAWLGDGASASAQLACGDEDVEHFRRAIGDGLACEPVLRRERTAWAVTMSGGRGGPKTSKFQAGLRRLGLLGNKHVPDQYLWAGTEQRRALLQGLMDTDGTVNPTGLSGAISCSFTGMNQALCSAVLTLVRSLGMKATLRSRDAKLNGRVVGTAREVQFTAWAEDAVFRLPRKAAKLKPRPERAPRSSTVQIVKCVPVESVPTVCIKVSSASSLFLAGHGMVPTHNTALIASILLAHLAGPEAVHNSQIVSGAQSKDQAAVIFELARKMVDLSPELRKLIRVQPSGKRLIGLTRNVLYRALAAEGKTAHGLSPILAILDEVGQIEGPTDKFVTAITTAQGAYKNPLLIAISTQAATDLDLFSTWIDAQAAAPDPQVVCHVYTAPEDCDLSDRKAWAAANPALGKFRALADMAKEAKKAIALPAQEPEFRNLNLNQRVESAAPFVSRSTWKANDAPAGKIDGRKVWAGLDLSSVNDLTALVGVDETGGVHAAFWLPKVGLAEKARKEKVPYVLWEQQGFLSTTPGRAIEYEFVAEYLRGFFDRCDVQALGFDRALMNFLKPWLIKANFSDAELKKFIPFGQGTLSMTPALRDLEARLLNRQLKHGGNPIMNMCAFNAKVVGDSGARKLDKSKARGRIDGMTALANAVGVMPQLDEKPPEYKMLFL